MELFLNVVWAALVIGVFVAYAARSRYARQTRVLRTQHLLALACGLTLLFPVVSASDDLHPTVAVVEDSAKRVRSAMPVQLTGNHAPLAVCLVAVWLLLRVLQFHALVPLELSPCPLPRPLAPNEGRAPPSCA